MAYEIAPTPTTEQPVDFPNKSPELTLAGSTRDISRGIHGEGTFNSKCNDAGDDTGKQRAGPVRDTSPISGPRKVRAPVVTNY